MSQGDLARRAGLSQAYVSELETGRKSNVTVRICNSLEDALGMTRGALSDPSGCRRKYRRES